MADRPVPMLCLYRPRKGKEAAFAELLRTHWPALRGAGLASPRPPELFRARDRRGRTVLVETFEWKDGRAAGRAHGMPEVLAIWGPMERLATEMDFLELAPLASARRRSRKTVPRSARSHPRGGRTAAAPASMG
jgi:hypothetical protein